MPLAAWIPLAVAAECSLLPPTGMTVGMIKLDPFQPVWSSPVFNTHLNGLTVPHKPRAQVIYCQKPVKAVCSFKKKFF